MCGVTLLALRLSRAGSARPKIVTLGASRSIGERDGGSRWQLRSSSGWPRRRQSGRTTGRMRKPPRVTPSPTSGTATATGRSSSGACPTESRSGSVRLDDRCCCPQFSPDGRSLYFTCDDRGSECLRHLPLRHRQRRGGQPATGHAGPRAAARPRSLAGRYPAGADGLARRRLRRRRHAGAAEPRRPRTPVPHRTPVHGVLAPLVAGRDAPRRHDGHPRSGHGRRRRRRGVGRDTLARRLGRVLRRPARLVA